MGLAKSILRIGVPKEIKKPLKTVRPVPPAPLPPEEINDKMMKNLQSIYVESSHTDIQVDNPYISKKPLEDNLQPGFLTTDQIIQLLDSHRLKSSTPQELAQIYHIDTDQFFHLVKYYGNFYVRNADREKDVKLKFHPLHR